jgi:hypothetical protein
MSEEKISATPSSTFWVWGARAVTLALAALSVRRLIILVGWERTLVFARDFLPAVIGMEAMTLAAYVVILALLATGRARRWGLALAIAWGAITAGAWVWPYALNLWYAAIWHLHLAKSLRHVVAVATRLGQWRAGLGLALALCSAKAYADLPRDRFDRGVLMASAFYAAFYLLAIGVVGRLLVVH